MSIASKPPFRADQVGSLLRPLGYWKKEMLGDKATYPAKS